jgi:sugar phosphate isomerase/epimerase
VRLPAAGGPHLTYCTNIHPGETWPEVRQNLARFVVAVKARVSPDAPFGVGLRLGDMAARALEDPAVLDELRAFLRGHGLYVFTINGFPYGPFHGAPVKERVYLPDWLDPERVAYSDRLARLLTSLLPDDPAVEGSVSTVPGAFRARVGSEADLTTMARHLLAHVATLHRLRETTGRTVVLALEPEPACILETTGEALAFLEQDVLAPAARSQLAHVAGLPAARVEDVIRRHVGLCVDACHAAVEFEDPAEAVLAIERAGIRIAKLQLSTGLRIPRLDAPARAALAAFAESVYLHQVVERRDGTFARWTDLPEAMAAVDADPAREWRVHFHVPVFQRDLGAFQNTQDTLVAFLGLAAVRPVTGHLEVETYTWDVLPPALRTTDVVSAVARELAWVREQLAP